MLGLPGPQLHQLPGEEDRLQLRVQQLLLCEEGGLRLQGEGDEEGRRQGSLVGFLEEGLVSCPFS